MAPLLYRRPFAHVPAVSCHSSGTASPGKHHAWVDPEFRCHTDTSVKLTPL
jgi:hypothetical protein